MLDDVSLSKVQSQRVQPPYLQPVLVADLSVSLVIRADTFILECSAPEFNCLS